MLRYVSRSVEQAGFPCPEGMSPALHRLLAGRGIASEAEAQAFLNPGRDSLHDPLLLSDMAAAVARIRGAMAEGEAICVYGDYDVDGVCASVILSGCLKASGAEVRVYLPSRHSEGYGLNEDAIRRIAGWAKLLVTVDCGVTSVELVSLAKALGLGVIVTDHHRPGDVLPDCPVVNPLLKDYPFPHLCGAGVAWKLVWALGGEAAAMPWADVAALATVADVVPLTGENRAIVRMGLDALNGGENRPGLAALIDAAGLADKRITSTAIAFQLAPRLNAGGRLGSAMRSLNLLSETDPVRAREEAAELEAENTRRRQVETQILKEAEAQLAGFNFAAHRALVLMGEDWNPGVIGLAASRLVEKYNYPTVLLAGGDGRLTGSCRSIEGVDIHAALTGCAHALVRFGGHRQAAGLTMLSEKLEEFRAALDDWLWANTDPADYVPARQYDAELDFGEATPGLVAALEGFQPTGFGNPAPVFRATAQVVEARPVGAEGAHLKLTLAQDGRRLGAIAFREGGRAGELTGDVDVLFTVSLNTWMGRAEPQLEVRALSSADVFQRLASKLADESRMQCEFLTEIIYNKKIVPDPDVPGDIEIGDLARRLAERPQGTLIVASDIACAGRLMRRFGEYPPDLYLEELPTDPRAFNALCVCPPTSAVGPGYEVVALAGVPVQWLPEGYGGTVRRLDDAPAWPRLLPEVEAMREAYKALMRVTRRPAWCASLWQLAHMTGEEAGMADLTAATALLTMADMGLFELDLTRQPIALTRSARARANPEDSAVWRLLCRWREEWLPGA